MTFSGHLTFRDPQRISDTRCHSEARHIMSDGEIEEAMAANAIKHGIEPAGPIGGSVWQGRTDDDSDGEGGEV